jgi:hypothetical protein
LIRSHRPPDKYLLQYLVRLTNLENNLTIKLMAVGTVSYRVSAYWYQKIDSASRNSRLTADCPFVQTIGYYRLNSRAK